MSAAPILVHFALLNEAQQSWEGINNLCRQQEILKRFGTGFTLEENPAAAAMIVFLESNNYKNWRHIPALLEDKLVRAHPEKCYTLNYRANPVDFFPGVYTSLARSRQRADWSRPGGYYIGNPNPWASEYENRPWQPKYLFSFRGAMSHPVRRRILALTPHWPGNPIHWVDRWFNHSEPEQREYLEEIADSQFVLCPRGIATSSHRLYEVMRLGRVPVILSDDWSPPQGPDWASFSVTIPERELDSFPARLRALTDAAPAMGLRAHETWKQWFSTEALLRRQLIELGNLAEQRRALTPPNYAKLWNSRSFYKRHRWLPTQRVLARLRRLTGPQH